MQTHDNREFWRSTRTHSVAGAAHSVEVAWPWEQEPGQGSVDQDTWMVSFVDILMLLLTLFVLLLAYQKGDSEKSRHISAAPRVSTPEQVTAAPVTVAQIDTTTLPQPQPPLQPAVQATQHAQANPPIQMQPTQEQQPPLLADAVPDAGTHASPRIPMTEIVGMPGMFGLPPVVETLALMSTETVDTPAVHTGTHADEPVHVPLQDSVDKLLADLNDSALQGRVEVNVLPDSIALEISDSILFAPASASLTEKGGRLLDELAATLKAHPYTLSVEGHTDNVPIQTARFPSNWELSSTRATEVTRRLIERGIAPARVRAVGFADTHPRADNASVEGRARNRRVSLVLMETR